jgi:hypothetical protein
VWCLVTRKPTQEEFDTCDRYELTYESPVYDPSGSLYAEQEAEMMDSRGQMKVGRDFQRHKDKLQAISLTLDDISLLQELKSHVHMPEVNM